MPPLNEALTESDIILFEEDKQFSRETITVLTGAGVLAPGAVLGRITASGKYWPSPPAVIVGKEGAETAVAVLAEKVDASAADAKAVVIRRHAIVNRSKLTFEAAVDTAPERDAKVAQLALVNILARTGA